MKDISRRNILKLSGLSAGAALVGLSTPLIASGKTGTPEVNN